MLTRRRLLQTTATLSAAALTPGCGPEPAAGTLASPYTREDPGPWADKVEVHQPVVYGGLVDATRVRVWVEVVDVDQNAVHEQSPDHYVSLLRVEDQDGKVLAEAAFPADAAARLVVVLELAATVTQLRVFETCNKHGTWMAAYDVSAVKVAPAGDARRPLTKDQPGEWADKTGTHVPIVTKIEASLLRVEVGDVSADKLHVSEVDHYIEEVVVYDQNAQEIARVAIGAANAPSFNLPVPAGTTSVRVISWCNLHDFWETEFML